MFSKLSEMTIFRSCSMNFFGNFGGTERGTSEVLKIIVLVQIKESPPLPLQIHSLCTIALTLQNLTNSKHLVNH